jgi:amino acid transporter
VTAQLRSKESPFQYPSGKQANGGPGGRRRSGLKRLFVGRPISSHKLEHQLLPKFLALPVFSSDPLSSVAYATEEMMLVLVLAGSVALSLMLPISLAIALLLVIVITSYRQTVRAYPRGGGSYIVSRENLGTIPGLIAASAILIDYVLTVAVSITAGTIAITSAAPGLAEHKVLIAISFVTLITLANLRGVREAGTLFAIPTYGFVLMVFLALGMGLVQCLAGCPEAATANAHLEGVSAISLFLVLRAFSSGATALTGVEAIADGVQAFRRPQSKNAAATLAIMGALSITMFLGITFMARALHVRTNEEIHEHISVLAQIGQTVYGRTFLFFLLQGFTAGILILAANTAYQDFPRLSAILARDRFMPSQFGNRGDRLVFSNGVVFLALLASLLIWAFDAELTRLIQLYVVGVFTAFTLSQAGMVRRWLRLKEEGWGRSMLINAVGAATTGVVLVIVAYTKFIKGAWIVMAAMPIIVGFFLGVSRHYQRVGRALRAQHLTGTIDLPNTFLFLVPDLGLATTEAVSYLRALRPDRIVPLFTGPAGDYRAAAERWTKVAPRLGQLELLEGVEGGRGLVRAVRAYVRAFPREQAGFLTVVIPETISGRSPLQFLRRSSPFWLKAALLFEDGVAICDVPLLPEETTDAAKQADRPLEPQRAVALIPISSVHDGTMRAVIYARSLRPVLVEGLFLAPEPEMAESVIEEWVAREPGVALTIVDAPFRDIGPPLLEEIRRHTRERDTIVTVVMPEFVVRRWWEHLLHNQTALYLKRLLLFEPGVVLISVPHRV